MKKIMFLVFFCISCNEKPKLEDYCVKRIEYNPLLGMLVPEGSISVQIEDKNHILRDKWPIDKLKKVLFYSIKEDYDSDFHIVSYEKVPFKIENGIITVPIMTAHFRPDILINDVRSENKWTPQQIQKALGGDLGLVFDKDTVRVKACDKQEFVMHDN